MWLNYANLVVLCSSFKSRWRLEATCTYFHMMCLPFHETPLSFRGRNWANGPRWIHHVHLLLCRTLLGYSSACFSVRIFNIFPSLMWGRIRHASWAAHHVPIHSLLAVKIRFSKQLAIKFVSGNFIIDVRHFLDDFKHCVIPKLWWGNQSEML